MTSLTPDFPRRPFWEIGGKSNDPPSFLECFKISPKHHSAQNTCLLGDPNLLKGQLNRCMGSQTYLSCIMSMGDTPQSFCPEMNFWNMTKAGMGLNWGTMWPAPLMVAKVRPSA